MGSSNFNQAFWSEHIFRDLHKSLVAKKIANTDYLGSITKMGDTVYFNGLSKPTISTYTGTAALTYEALQDSRLTLIVDKADSFAFAVTDPQAFQAGKDIQNSQMTEAKYGLAENCDAVILGSGVYNDAYTSMTVTAGVTSANVLSTIGLIEQRLEEQSVPANKIWIVLPPWMKQKMLLAGIKFQIGNGLKGVDGMAWTDELGYTVYISNNLTESGVVSAHQTHVMAGSPNAIAFADQITETETLRDTDYFRDLCRGLHTYGIKVARPKELVHAYLYEAIETTI